MRADPLWWQLQSKVELQIPGFTETVPRGFVKQLSFEPQDCAAWFQTFVDRLLEAPGFLPIYRMSDGEFLFSCGRKLPPLSLLPMYPLGVPKAYVRHLLGIGRGVFKSGTPGYGFEQYDPAEWRRVKEGYADRVRRVAERGILAMNLVVQKDGFAREYLKPMCRWFDRNEVRLHRRNYFPFYFVYALLLGPEGRRLYRGRRILVVTSDQEDKSDRIIHSLKLLGAKSVTFIAISREKSMMDRIDTRDCRDIDLVLIGAGVGALNILEQVEHLEALSIDAGYVLDCLWRPERFMGRRVYTMPDGGLAAMGLLDGTRKAS